MPSGTHMSELILQAGSREPPSTMNRVLIVEDDPKIARLVEIHLRDLKLAPEWCASGGEAVERFRQGEWALVVLDLMLPDMDGFDVCKQIRAASAATPILMLTARSEELDVVLGLELGADDYLTKPFGIRELIARVRALLRRAAAAQADGRDDEIVFHELTVYPGKRKVMLRDEPVELTAREYDLLECFITNPGRAFSRTELLEQVWGYQFSGYDHTVNSLINRLRGKIEADPSHPVYIRTLWGVGYRFADHDDLRR